MLHNPVRNRMPFEREPQMPAMNKSQRASETQSNINQSIQRRKRTTRPQVFDDFNSARSGGLDEMKSTLVKLKAFLSDPKRRATPAVVKYVQHAIQKYESAVKSALGMPTYSDSVTLQSEAPKDIPTMPLDGYQLLHRKCMIVKTASGGTTAGGFYATLIASDLVDFVKNSFYRIKSVTSWTVPRADGSLTQGTFAGVSVPASNGADGTEVMPIWSENWTPVGQGFAGIKTLYPLGDFPQLSTGQTTLILTHYTALGGTGGVTGVTVVFHVEVECLV